MNSIWTPGQIERLNALIGGLQCLHSEISRADANAPGLDSLVEANESLARVQQDVNELLSREFAHAEPES